MIFIKNLSVEFSGNVLFDNVSFIINSKDRIGLVGKNGAGKTTLLNIISGKQKQESGSVVVAEGKTIGYLPQELSINTDKTVLSETMMAFEEALKIEEENQKIITELENRADYESKEYTDLINKLTENQDIYSIIGDSNPEGRAEKVLRGLGFKISDLNRPLSEFSGGWQMRVELAKLLLIKPDLMLLDEPTNHLDIESILWVEKFFSNYSGAIMMVSHDRMFLDNITNRTIEIVFGKTYDFKASYTKYFELREERLEQQRAAYKNQQEYIAKQEAFITRFKAKSTKASQAQSKIKQLAKIELISFDELDMKSIKINFPSPPRSGKVVISVKDVQKNYNDHKVFENVNFNLERGERIAFTGKNGEGKSTLVKLLVGEENFGGEIVVGHNVNIGYYAQIQESTLDENNTVLKTIEDVATGEMAKLHKIRGLLGAFLFSGKDVDKKVKILSGGEKSRLALAKLMLTNANLLILDEPTNHLDIPSKEILKRALVNYTGTLILVSHDRDFLKGLTTRTFEFKNKGIKEHLGDIDEFLSNYEVASFRDFELRTGEKKTSTKNKSSNQKELRKQHKKNQNSIGKIEQEISSLESQISQLEATLHDPKLYASSNYPKELVSQHSSLKLKLETDMVQWEKLNKEVKISEEKLSNL